MDNIERIVRLKIRDIVGKLQKLECTLLGNKDDAWVMELLFKPGFHRYNLIEWMLSKLKYDVGKISEPQNSQEERMKDLQSVVSNLGIWRQNSYDVIKGTAAVKEQLEFWCKLVEVMWLKYQIMNTSMSGTDEGVALSPEKNKQKCIDEEFEEASSCITEICESVNLKHLFEHDVQLLAPDVQREIKNLSPSKSVHKIPTLEELKEGARKNPVVNAKELYRTLLSQVSIDENVNDDTSDTELNKLEEELCNVSADFKNCAQSSFNDVYNDLKPLILHAKADKFTDVGPAFKTVEPLLESLLELKNSFPKLESSHSKLLKINSDLEDLISQDTLADANYVNILKLVKDEN